MKSLLPLLFLLSSSSSLFAQALVGYTGSNYAGYHAALFNPALLAQTPYSLDINVVSLQGGFDNDFVSLRNDGFFGSKTLQASYDDFADFTDRALILDFTEGETGQQTNLRLGVDVMGPSALIPLSPIDAIGIGVRFRNSIHIDQLGSEAARLAFDDFVYPPLWDQNFESDDVRLSAMNWIEYQFSYARNLYETEDRTHYLAGGATVKLLQGLQALYLYSDDLNYNFFNDDFLTLTQSNLQYGHSEGFNINDPVRNFRFDDLGFGADLGVVYEWRPEGEAYNGKPGQTPAATDRSAVRYRLKASLALLDIGSINFSRSPKAYDRTDGTIDIELWDITNGQIGNVGDFDDTLGIRFPDGDRSSTSFTMTLPRTLTAQVDAHIIDGLYVGINGWWSPRSSNDPTKVHGVSRITLNPRYEMRWFEAGIPLSVQPYSGFDAGLFLRLGPVILGSANVFTNAFGKSLDGADVYLAARIPLLHGRRIESVEGGDSNQY